jgi:glycosidase
MSRTPEALTLPPDHDLVPGELPSSLIARRIAMQREQFRHDNLLCPLAPSPDDEVEIRATSGELLGIVAAGVLFTTDGAFPGRTARRVAMELCSVEWDAHAGFVTHWSARLPAFPAGTVVRYRIGGWRTPPDDQSSAEPDVWAHDGQGFWFLFPGDEGLSTFAYRVEPAHGTLPEWVRRSVVYQIFLDRFHPGTPDGRWSGTSEPTALHGGTLRGVIQALPYLEDLGVTCLWLTPLTASPSYHRYDTTDYFTVDPALGSNDDLRALVDAAHARDIRVILDYVPAHCSWEHPAFVDARPDATAPTASWFTFEERPDRYRMFSGLVPSMPLVNSQDGDARAHLIGSAVRWLRDYNVDGLRVDHAVGVGTDFYTALREALRQAKPDAFTVGEAVETPDCMRRYRNRVDALLDYPLSHALRHTFGERAWDVRRFTSFLRAYASYMAEGPGFLSFLDNHDLNRFLYISGGDVRRLKLAAMCQFTLPPPPIIYYGTEIGLSQEIDIVAAGWGGDAEVRRDMPWSPEEQDLDLRDFHRRLIALRRAHPVLWSGSYRINHVDDDRQTFSYVCSPSHEEDPLLLAVAFNLGDAAAEVDLPPVSGEWLAVLASGAETAVNMGRVHLPPLSGCIFVMDENASWRSTTPSMTA